MNNLKVIETADGGRTLHSELFNASYHSLQGAMEESMKVFIELGLQYIYPGCVDKVKIFEMGFGSGLNALLSFQFSASLGIQLDYTGVEAHPVTLQKIQELNYSSLFDEPWRSFYLQLHAYGWNVKHACPPFGQWQKLKTTLQDFQTDEQYDLIYFDAFAPDCQPELWSEAIMNKMHLMLREGGVLTTYCAKGSFKRTLKSVGFKVESHPGPGRKREITRAIK